MSDGLMLSELEIALNDVVLACIQASDMHATAAEACEDAEIARTLDSLARSREETAAWVGNYLANHGEGPNKPTEERELIKKAIMRTKSMLSGNHTAALLSDCRAEEEKVRDATDAALALELEADLRSRLRELRADAGTRIRMLDARIGDASG